jgi:hypothetical protein
MNLRRSSRVGLMVVLAVAWVVLAGAKSLAQGLTPDPYNIVGEGNAQYAPFMYAVQPTAGSMFPNQDRLLQDHAGYRYANRFQSFMEGLNGPGLEGDLGPGGRAGLGTPYYRANRRYDRDFDRLYRPNRDADATYYSSQEARNTKYFEAMQEKDPQKRARLLREYNLENLRAARNLSLNRPAPERESGRAAPGPTGSVRDPLLDAPGPAPDASGARRPTSSLRGSSALDGAPGTAPGSRATQTVRPRSTLDTRRPVVRPSPGRPVRPSLEGMDNDLDTVPPSRRSGLDPLLDNVAPRRSPSDVLQRSESLDRRIRPRTPRAPAVRDAAPPPLDR